MRSTDVQLLTINSVRTVLISLTLALADPAHGMVTPRVKYGFSKLYPVRVRTRVVRSWQCADKREMLPSARLLPAARVKLAETG